CTTTCSLCFLSSSQGSTPSRHPSHHIGARSSPNVRVPWLMPSSSCRIRHTCPRSGSLRWSRRTQTPLSSPIPVSSSTVCDLLCTSYRHPAANSTVPRTIGYGFPAELHAHVKAIALTTHFGSPRISSQRSFKRPSGGAVVLSSRDVDVTQSYLHLLYKTMGYIPASAGLNRPRIGGFLGQYPSPDDLWMNFAPMGPSRHAASSLSLAAEWARSRKSRLRGEQQCSVRVGHSVRSPSKA
ncbi:hypothetical protein EDB84DRAFT_1630401, partial [Lactarius hengduanensis]